MDIQSLNSAGNAVAVNPQPARSTRGAEVQAEPKSAAPQLAQKPEPSLEEVKQAVNAMQQIVQAKADNLTFAVDQDAGKTIVRLMDKQSGEVILQIPSKEMIAIAAQIDKVAGMLFQQKA